MRWEGRGGPWRPTSVGPLPLDLVAVLMIVVAVVIVTFVIGIGIVLEEMRESGRGFVVIVVVGIVWRGSSIVRCIVVGLTRPLWLPGDPSSAPSAATVMSAPLPSQLCVIKG